MKLGSLLLPMLSTFLVVSTQADNLPPADSSIKIPAQQWKFQQHPRTIKVYIRYPGSKLSNINSGTGLILSLHNWGGTDWAGSIDPQVLANKYNLIAISVDYLQSGDWDASRGVPYDYGFLQAIDALRALYCVYSQLQSQGISFDHGRIYTCGGSGGGNVSLMANKFAPRTFACVIDVCGMAKLSDEIAFGLEGQVLNAGYNRQSQNPAYLSQDQQQIRFVAEPSHLKTLKLLGNSARICIVHGASDYISPVDYALELSRNFKQAGIACDTHIICEHDLDGKIFTDTGHAIGNRTLIAEKVAGKYLDPNSPLLLRRSGPNDFDLKDDKVRYATTNGVFIVSFNNGYPEIEFRQNKDIP